jgi:hypothetical protein
VIWLLSFLWFQFYASNPKLDFFLLPFNLVVPFSFGTSPNIAFVAYVKEANTFPTPE